MVDSGSTQLHYATVADVGGTNARFQFLSFTKTSIEPTIIKSFNYQTNDFPSLKEVMADFLKEYLDTDKHPKIAAISIAGAVLNNKTQLANATWPLIDGNQIAKDLKIPHFVMLNDFVAIGLSLLKLPKEEIITIIDAPKITGEPMGVVGPGTGLGECMLFSSPSQNGNVEYYVKGGEGGHADMSVRNQTEWEWYNYLKDNFPDVGPVITVERSFCGPSIPYMYAFFAEKEGKKIENVASLNSKEILKNGVENKDPIANKMFKFLLSLYGNEVGSYGLRNLPYAGIYLVGSVTSTITDYLVQNPKNEFVDNYFAKEPVLVDVLKKIPVYIVKYVDLGLLGAFVEAQRLIDQ